MDGLNGTHYFLQTFFKIKNKIKIQNRLQQKREFVKEFAYRDTRNKDGISLEKNTKAAEIHFPLNSPKDAGMNNFKNLIIHIMSSCWVGDKKQSSFEIAKYILGKVDDTINFPHVCFDHERIQDLKVVHIKNLFSVCSSKIV